MSARLRIGVSACLLGRPVRYDGGDKHDRYFSETWGQWVDWAAVCPEAEAGLGVPRPAMDLVGTAGGYRLVIRPTGQDLTEQVISWTDRWLHEVPALDGFVLKERSPSCGMRRVRVYSEEGGRARRSGVGVFARELMERFPLLPVEEAERLHDPALRENFVERLFALRRWRDFLSAVPSADRLVVFHAAAKMSLLSHHPQKYRELGRLVAAAGKRDPTEVLEEYGLGYAEILQHRATRRRHLDVLLHLAGRLRRRLEDLDRAELAEAIAAYGAGRAPLLLPITLLRHHFRRHGGEWARSQTYLNPHPDELMMRSHV
jgi:uncharacterized protein YbgA (DUF1722 family)/uncharacterized protein YbbK (DUF523 family)